MDDYEAKLRMDDYAAKLNPLWYQLEREKKISKKLTDIVYDAIKNRFDKYDCQTPIILRCNNNQCLHYSINQDGVKEDIIYCSNKLYKCEKCDKYYCDEKHVTNDGHYKKYLCIKHSRKYLKEQKRKEQEQDNYTGW